MTNSPFKPVAEIGKVYKHYKGHLYKVVGSAKHSETLEDLVVYRELGSSYNHLWARPFSMWTETVDVEGRKVKRFTLEEDPPFPVGISLSQALELVEPYQYVEISACTQEGNVALECRNRCSQIPYAEIGDYLSWRVRQIAPGQSGQLKIILEEPYVNQEY